MVARTENESNFKKHGLWSEEAVTVIQNPLSCELIDQTPTSVVPSALLALADTLDGPDSFSALDSLSIEPLSTLVRSLLASGPVLAAS